jgi:hypothetical protein
MAASVRASALASVLLASASALMLESRRRFRERRR